MKVSACGFVVFISASFLSVSTHGQDVARPVDGTNPDPQVQRKRDADDAYRRRDYARTIELTSQVLEQAPQDAVAFYLRGSARVELGIAGRDPKLIRTGIEDARKAIEADPARNVNYYLPYLYGMSNLTALEGELHHAQTAVTVATDAAARPGVSDGAKSNILYQRGIAHTKLGDDKSAAADFRSTLELDANHLAARFALGEALRRTGDVQSAEEVYSAATERFPNDPLVFNNRGMFYQSLQRHADAVADFTRAIELSQNHLEARLNRGFTQLSAGDYAAAQADFEKAVELSPNHAPAHSLLATSKLLQNNIRGAFDDYLKVIELRPSYAPARADIGFAYFFARHYDTAAQAFEQALLLAPDAAYLAPWRYAALTLAGRQDAANQAYRSVAEKPVDQRDWFDLLTLYFMGKIEDRDLLASIDAQNATLRDAQLCEAYYFIGLRLQKDGQGDPSRYFQRAIESRATQLSAYRAAKLELERARQ